MTKIQLPKVIAEFCRAHEILKAHYASSKLGFTLDGKLVGDLGEAIASEFYELALCETRTPGIDARTQDGRSVQIKATGRPNAGPAFSFGKGTADHLIFLAIDFKGCVAEVKYNGPEDRLRRHVPKAFQGTHTLSLRTVLTEDANVPEAMRLKKIK